MKNVKAGCITGIFLNTMDEKKELVDNIQRKSKWNCLEKHILALLLIRNFKAAQHELVRHHDQLERDSVVRTQCDRQKNGVPDITTML